MHVTPYMTVPSTELEFAMIWLLLTLAAPIQTNDCIGTADTIDCRTSDGSTYIERRIGEQVVRQGTDRDGRTWNEYVTPVFDGTRTEGVDSAGHTWSQQCNPRFGTTGSNRNGGAVFIPPAPSRPTQNGQPAANPCG